MRFILVVQMTSNMDSRFLGLRFKMLSSLNGTSCVNIKSPSRSGR